MQAHALPFVPMRPNFEMFVGGGTQYTLTCISGIVVGFEKRIETRVHGSGTATSVSINSSAVVHIDLILRTLDGVEHSVQLRGVDLIARQGHHVSVVFADDSRNSHCIAVTNHSTASFQYLEHALWDLFQPPPVPPARFLKYFMLSLPLLCLPLLYLFTSGRDDRAREFRVFKGTMKLVPEGPPVASTYKQSPAAYQRTRAVPKKFLVLGGFLWALLFAAPLLGAVFGVATMVFRSR